MAINFNNVRQLFIGGKEVSVLNINGSKVWQKASDFGGLKFTNVGSSNATVALTRIGTLCPNISLDYSTDGLTWTSWDQSAITLAPNAFVYIKATTTNESTCYTQDNDHRNQFTITGQVKASGNIMSLLDGSNFENLTTITVPRCFSKLFNECSGLYDAGELTLPATTVTLRCYAKMFFACRSMVSAPRICATTLTDYCFENLFNQCNSLRSIKIDYTGNFSPTYFSYWVNAVYIFGTFYYNGSDTTRGVSAIPANWTITRF